MAVALFDLTVASYLQSLGAVIGFLEKGRVHCTENGIDLNDVVETRLFSDMLPFRFQVISVAHHSLGAIKGMQSGRFSPPPSLPDLDYSALQNHVVEARSELEKLTPDEVNALEGRDMAFEIGDRKIPFTTENFAMTFSLPNLYFHATTAYDILRMKGVPLGKRDYMGQMRIKS